MHKTYRQNRNAGQKNLVLRMTKKYFFTLFSILFIFGLFSFVMVRFSGVYPFKETRELLVTTAMTTRTHQWIAKLVASESTIAAVLDANKVLEPTESVDIYEILNNMQMAKDAGQAEQYDTELLLSTVKADKYIGYTVLEDGLYLKDVQGEGFKGKLMVITDPSRVKVATTRTLGTRGDLVKQMVPMNNGIAGINGGWFSDPNYESSGGVPTGYVIKNGEVVFSSEHPAMIVGLTADNVLIMGNYSQKQALEMGVRDCLSSSPIIVINGEGVIIKGDGGWGVAPRTVIGQMQDGAIVFLTIDGRQAHSVGATLRQAQDVLLEHKVHNAMMLDGGSSTTMFYDGIYLNSPSLGYERYIPTSFIVTKK